MLDKLHLIVYHNHYVRFGAVIPYGDCRYKHIASALVVGIWSIIANRRIMKYKKSILIGASVAIIGTTGVALASTSTPPTPTVTPPVKIATVKSVTQPIKQETQTVNDTPTVQKQTTPVVEQPAPNQADTNKNELQTVILAQAKQTIPLLMQSGVSQNDIDAAINMQWACVDKMITNSVGYADYAAAYNSQPVQMLMTAPYADGTYSVYTDLSCRMQNRIPIN